MQFIFTSNKMNVLRNSIKTENKILAVESFVFFLTFGLAGYVLYDGVRYLKEKFVTKKIKEID
jgi:hypothetical protein